MPSVMCNHGTKPTPSALTQFPGQKMAHFGANGTLFPLCPIQSSLLEETTSPAQRHISLDLGNIPTFTVVLQESSVE